MSDHSSGVSYIDLLSKPAASRTADRVSESLANSQIGEMISVRLRG